MRIPKHLMAIRKSSGNDATSRFVPTPRGIEQIVVLDKGYWKTLDYLENNHALQKEEFFTLCARFALMCAGPFEDFFPATLERAIYAAHHLFIDKPQQPYANDNLEGSFSQNLLGLILEVTSPQTR